jgi:hypothetical protein
MGYRLGDRTTRVIRFMFGLNDPRVLATLAGYGFTEADRDEGWSLLYAIGQGGPPVVPIEGPNVSVLVQIDAWENRWFPIVDASLRRHFPAVRKLFFRNLSQTEGLEVIMSVGSFVERFEALSEPAGPYGAEGPKAAELLSRRGLTSAVAEAKALLDSLEKVDTRVRSTWDVQQRRLFAAESVLWAWYLEWSRVARVAIKERALLRQLGFLGESRVEEEEGADLE